MGILDDYNDEGEGANETLAGVSLGKLLATPSLSLLVMGPSGTGNVPVPAEGVLVFGRSAECDVRIDDAKLSRRHAELRCGQVLSLVDLGSRNGTYLREDRLKPNVPVQVRVGDSIAIGGTVLVLQRAGASADRPRHIWTHGYFEARLEEECARAARGGEPFAVLRLRLDRKSASAAPTSAQSTLLPTMITWVGDADMLATYAPNDYEVLLTGTPPAEADARAAELTAQLAASGTGFELAVAAYPRDGRTPEALMEHATRALRSRDAASNEKAASAPMLPLGAIERMDRVVRRVAEGTISVLVLGETGVGKEVLARRIHELSSRAKQPMVSLNCAALAESLLESELFGHEKGAFTGALQAKPGLLESASGGTVFLDEVGEMPLSVQAKLLRVIEQREVTRVGALRPKPIDVRFVAATNRDLEAEIAAGRFRQDLYFRLNGIALSIPPLRERTDEIGPLARAFADQASRAMGRPRAPQIGPEAFEALLRYEWPGNIRELRNVMERAVLLCTGEVITREHLPMEKMGALIAAPPSRQAPPRPESRPPPPPADWEAVDEVTRETPIAQVEALERQVIVEALDKCGGNQSQAAKMLGMSRQTIIRRIEEYDIPRPRKRE